METIQLIVDWFRDNQDGIETLTQFAAIIGGVVAALWALYEFHEGRIWKKTELAHKILNEMFGDKRCVRAMRMVDWERSFPIGDKPERITRDDVVGALRIQNTVFSQKEMFIRDCFDTLLDHLQMLEHYVDIGLVRFEDIRYPLRYSVEELSNPRLRKALEDYMRTYDFGYAAALLEKYDFWEKDRDASRAQCFTAREASPDAEHRQGSAEAALGRPAAEKSA